MTQWSESARVAAQQMIGTNATVRLEVGSGYSPTPGFMHVDINPQCPNVDWVGPADDLPWADATFAGLRAVDVLEHIPYAHTDRTLAEWARVMRAGAPLYVQVPDARTIMERYLVDPDGLVVAHLADQPPIVSAAWRLLGGHFDDHYTRGGDDWRRNAHYALFDARSIDIHLRRAGFTITNLTVNQFPNLLVDARKD